MFPFVFVRVHLWFNYIVPVQFIRLMKPIVVIADDLSGAAELAAVARRHGMSVELQTAFCAETSAEVICVATQTRASLPAAAARTVSEVTRAVRAIEPRWIFKKCDSVLRGPVLAEARAVAAVMGVSKLTLVSANPSRDRFVKAGEFWVNGRRLHETGFAQDPENPRTTSRVVDLLSGDLTEVHLPDVTSIAGLTTIAATLDKDRLPVGGADFFAALLEARESGTKGTTAEKTAQPDAGATLLVCGSKMSWPQRSVEARARGIPVVAMPYDWPAIFASVSNATRMLIGIGEAPETHGRAPAELVNGLGEAVMTLLEHDPFKHLLVEGGATAAVVMQRLQWSRFAVGDVRPSGLAVLHPWDVPALDVIIKPGSYPWPAMLWPAQTDSLSP